MEQTFRAAYFASTVKRDEMLREGRGDEMDAIIKRGRFAQGDMPRGE